jgi:hypothetical protein
MVALANDERRRAAASLAHCYIAVRLQRGELGE